MCMHRQEDRARFIVAASLLRLSAGKYLGQPPHKIHIDRRCQRCGESHGKPRLRHRRLKIEVSLSHSGEYVASAVTIEDAVGLDIERIDSSLQVLELAPLILTQAERMALKALADSELTESFLTIWTRKEAILKALGTGLMVSPNAFSVSGPAEAPRLVSWPENGSLRGSLSLVNPPVPPGYVACLAATGKIREIVTLDGSSLITSWKHQVCG